MKTKNTKLHLLQQIASFIFFYKPTYLEEKFYGRVRDYSGNFLGRGQWVDSASPSMGTIASREQFEPMTIEKKLLN